VTPGSNPGAPTKRVIVDNQMIKKVVNFFDKLEDIIRGVLSRHPIVYTLIGGVAIVLFWRGVWHTADILQARGGLWGWFFYEPTNLLIVIIILLATGLFVSYFIGDTILISGLKKQKKTADVTENELLEEEAQIVEMRTTITEIKKEVDEIKEAVLDHQDANSHLNKHHPGH
jgi:hypothetical protein